MKVYRPIKTNIRGQGFGQNLACAKTGADGKPLSPFKIVNAISDGVCPAGSVPFYPAIGMKGHNGVDNAAYRGEAVYFPVFVDGIEWEAASEVDRDGGIGVNVRSKQPVPLDHLPPQAVGSLNLGRKQWEKLGKKVHLKFKFWHLLSHTVYDKKPIKSGDLIGYSDSTGASGGDHLHWSMKICDETSWFSLDGDNGYTGALDFMDWYENVYVLDALAKPPPPPDTPLSASHQIAVFAAQLMAQGQTAKANSLFSLANFLRSMGY